MTSNKGKYDNRIDRDNDAFANAEARVKVEGFRALMEDGSAGALRTMALAMKWEYEVCGEYREIIKPLGRDGISHLRKMLLDSRMPGHHAAAIALIWVEDPSAKDALLEALESGDDRTKEYTLMAMGDRPDHTMIEQVAKYLDDDNYQIRFHAIRFIGECEAREYLDVIKRSLNVDDPGLQLILAAAMARLGDEEGARILRNVAENSVHSIERGFAQAQLLSLELIDKEKW